MKVCSRTNNTAGINGCGRYDDMKQSENTGSSRTDKQSLFASRKKKKKKSQRSKWQFNDNKNTAIMWLSLEDGAHFFSPKKDAVSTEISV